MKFTAPTKALLSACQLVSAAVAARTTKPILSNVKATAEGDSLVLVAYDTELGIRYTLPGVQVTKPGSAILAIDRLIQILRESTDTDITLTATDDGTKAAVGTSRFEMPGWAVDEFPDLPTVEAAEQFHEIDAATLRVMIRRTAFAADKKDSTRFALSGVLWEAEGGDARLVATDSKRLAVSEQGTRRVVGGSSLKHLVPSRAVALLDRNLSDDAGPVRVVLRANEAMFQVGPAMIYTRLLEGRYPPYRDIIGQSRKTASVSVRLPVADFLSRVRLAAIMTDAESKRVDMAFKSGKVLMKARGAEAGSSDVVLGLPEYDGPAVEISFDPQYLIDVLRVVGEEFVTLEMSTGTRPAIFKTDASYTYLVMPLGG